MLHASARSQRILIWVALVFGSLFGYGYVVLTGLFPPPSPNLDAAQVAHLYASNNTQLRLGIVVCLVTGGFSLPWSLVASIQMARHEKGLPVWAILQLLAGTLGVILFMGPALLWGVAAFSAGREPAVTSLMHEFAFLTFVTPTSFFIFQAIPMVVIGLTQKDDAKSAFPRWVGYMMLWYLICSEAGVVAQLFKSGPFAWNGLFAFWIPAVGFGIWFPIISYTMLRAIKLQEAERTRAL